MSPWVQGIEWLARGSQQAPVQFEGRAKFEAILDKALQHEWWKLPMGEMVGKIGLEFLGTPYVGWTLERDVDREFCFVTLDALDCVTFFETTLGMARAIKRFKSYDKPATPRVTPEHLLDEVTETRYRGGKVGDYTSRLHYTLDWIADNEHKEVERNVTAGLPGARRLEQEFSYMSKHPEVYRQLKAHPELVGKIREIEARLTAREWFYVPTSGVAAIEDRLRTGDIVGLVATTPGLDINHTGLIVREGKVARFLNASSIEKKVVLGPRISEVLGDSKRDRGLVVARPVEL